MSGIAALYRPGGQPADRAALQRMDAAIAYRGPDHAGLWCDESVGLVHRALWSTPEAALERQPLQTPDGLVVVGDSRIDNREDLQKLLGLPSAQLTDSAVIAAAYSRWHEDCPEKLIGDFAFCIWDPHRRTMFCARDHIGVKPLYYHHSAGQFLIASDISAILKAGGVKRELNPDRVADYLLPDLDDAERTFYRHIMRLAPGHSLSVSPDSIRRRRYWQLDATRELRYAREDDYADHLREIFFESVRCRLRGGRPIGAMLSGGLDSSSIVCAADRLLESSEGSLHTFTLGFGRTPVCDEQQFSRAVVENTHVTAHVVSADESEPFADFNESLTHNEEPYYAPNLFLNRAMYQAARASGSRVILDGLDGDHAISHGLARITELARGCRMVAASREILAVSRGLNRPAWPLMKSRAIGPLLPAALLRAWRASRRGGGLPWSPLSADFTRTMAHRLPQPERRVPRTAREDHVAALSSGIMPFALEVTGRTAARLQVEPRYPFFDRRLLEYCTALPADQKLRNGWTRWVMRLAMKDVLPESIRWRRDKANLGPNFTAGLLRSGIAAKNTFPAVAPYVDSAQVRQAQRRLVEKPSDADAMLLWRVATLDAWLSARALS